MRRNGGLKLPLTTTQEIKLTKDQDAIDFLLDIDFVDKFDNIKNIYNIDKPTFMLINSLGVEYFGFTRTSFRIVLFLMRYPPPVWWNYKDQGYKLFVSNNLHGLGSHFSNMQYKMGIKTLKQFRLINEVINFLSAEINKQQKRGVY